ncbi:MAG: hypothetical protein FGM40_02900 [Rhodocyclaceae bacterium]|nr:hypothetical protein [Rhodocyclaceae bacterium]
MSPPMTQAAAGDFKSSNPHALAMILEASETRSIIAATDIFDIRGNLLWARNQPVSPAHRTAPQRIREALPDPCGEPLRQTADLVRPV